MVLTSLIQPKSAFKLDSASSVALVTTFNSTIWTHVFMFNEYYYHIPPFSLHKLTLSPHDITRPVYLLFAIYIYHNHGYYPYFAGSQMAQNLSKIIRVPRQLKMDLSLIGWNINQLDVSIINCVVVGKMTSKLVNIFMTFDLSDDWLMDTIHWCWLVDFHPKMPPNVAQMTTTRIAKHMRIMIFFCKENRKII